MFFCGSFSIQIDLSRHTVLDISQGYILDFHNLTNSEIKHYKLPKLLCLFCVRSAIEIGIKHIHCVKLFIKIHYSSA